jgi:adenine-specific DNA-methyltransferase
VRCVLDEVFGSENFVSMITYSKTSGATVVLLPGTADYVLWYAKNIEQVKYRRLYNIKRFGGDGASKYDQIEMPDGSRRALRWDEDVPTGSKVFRQDNLMSQSMGREKGEGAASWFVVHLNGRDFTPNMRSRWKTNEEGMSRLLAARRVTVTGNTLAYVRFLDDFPAYPFSNTWMDIGGIQSRADPKIYVVQTATTAIERCLLMTTDPGDLVLDPTCGSGTTAYVAEQWGRRWITCDTSRVALALARTRLMAARYPYYLLADSFEGIKKESELTGKMPPDYLTASDIRRGFVYKRVPHVTLKSIANNPDIKEGMTRAEIDAAIARHADTETLFDQPY